MTDQLAFVCTVGKTSSTKKTTIKSNEIENKAGNERQAQNTGTHTCRFIADFSLYTVTP